MAKPVFVTPQCCEEVKETSAVFLRFWESKKSNKPVWTIRYPNIEYGFELNGYGGFTQVRFCPFCGELLPDVVKAHKPTTKKIYSPGKGIYKDDYCGTCDQRNMNCTCLAPEALWEPYKYYKDFGDDRICQCGHSYYRHFDWGSNYSPGCKYCDCYVFQEKTEDS